MKNAQRNLSIAILMTAFIALAIVPSEISAESIDEYQPSYDTGYNIVTTTIGGGAQGFKVDDPWLYIIEFYIDPANTNNIDIRIDNDLDPNNGYVYHTGLIDVSGWSKGWHEWSIRYEEGYDVELTPGQQYYFMILGDFPVNNGAVWYGTSGNPYSKGEAYYIGTDGSSEAVGYGSVDFAFYLYTDVNPVAAYSYYNENLTLHVNAEDSYTPDGDPITSYQWDWENDGIYDASGITASHNYSVAGDYQVVLKVTDEDGHNDTETKTIHIAAGVGNPPTARFTYSTDNYTLYVNASNSTDPEGNITSYQWDWDGDGYYDTITTNPVTSHVYGSTGNYSVTLRVVDNQSNDNTTTKVIEITYGGGGTPDNPNNWFNWKLPFSWFSIATMVMIGLMGMGASAFYLKPESIKHVGYAPAAGTMLITVFLIAAILMYHAGIAWYWIAGVVLLIIFILCVTLKVVAIKKKKLIKSVFGRRKAKRRKR